MLFIVLCKVVPEVWLFPGGGGVEGGLAYERGGDARRKFWIKPLKETVLRVVQTFFDP